MARQLIAVENSGNSSRRPRPVRPRSSSAASTPLTSDIPVAMSTIATPKRTGGPSGVPIIAISPVSASTITSVPASGARGPCEPKPLIEA